MISVKEKTFKLDTDSSSYIFSVNERGHLEHIYYGKKIADQNYEALRHKNTVTVGSAVEYDTKDFYSLDTACLEYSGIGKGDFRHSPIELIMPDGSFVCDFVYDSHELSEGSLPEEGGLPFAYGKAKTLSVTLKDVKYSDVKLILNYTVYEKANVIARNVKLVNNTSGYVYIRKIMSSLIDFPEEAYDLVTFDGSWTKEAHIHRRPVEFGTLVNDSLTGGSSNRHNPGTLLMSRDANEERGSVYAFNLIYSGNHYTEVEKAPFGTHRVMSGINPHCFLWRLSENESFVTPQAVMTYSSLGTNGASVDVEQCIGRMLLDKGGECAYARSVLTHKRLSNTQTE